MEINVHAATTQLSRLLERVEAGEEIIITRHGRPVPLHHRDPFDRILMAEALEEGMTLVSRAPVFACHPVPTLCS